MLELPATLRLHGSPSSPRGRCLHTTQAFGPGDLIATFTTPSIATPDSPHLQETCSYCLCVTSPVRACSGCKTVAYCSTRCQKADWSLAHKQECKAFKRVRAEGHDVLPTPVRALIQVLVRDDMRTAVMEMEGHEEMYRAKGEEWRDFELQALAALHYLGREANERSIAEALGILCKLSVNSFNRLDPDSGQTGVFVHPGLAMVNHSCLPNAFVQFTGRTAIIKARWALRMDEEVEISYIEYNLPRPARRSSLKERWGFECMCPRCADDLNVYQVCQRYPHLDLNAFSLAPDLDKLRKPPQDPLHTTKSVQLLAEKVYPAAFSESPAGFMPPNAANIARVWHLCEPLRRAGLYAIEPLPRILGEASIYFGEREKYPYSLAVSCFLSLNVEAFREPAPFMPSRVKDLVLLANLLSNTASISGTTIPREDGTLQARLAASLLRMDQASMTQAILALAVHYGPLAHSKDWPLYQEACQQLSDVTNLRGREKQSALIQTWSANPQDPECQAFFKFAVIEPIQDLSSFALEIMDTEFDPRRLGSNDLTSEDPA